MNTGMYKEIKEFSLGIIVSVLLTLLLFMFSEIIFRWQLHVFPFRYEFKQDKGYVLDDELGYRVKNVAGYNSLGLRNPEILPKSNEFRILFLGDSVVEGFETVLLKDRLKAYYPHAGLEIIDAGISGYTTKQEFGFLKKYGMQMKPDLVILGFVLNDLFIYLHRPVPGGKFTTWHPFVERSWFAGNGFLGKLFSHSYFAHFIVKRINFMFHKLKKRFGRPVYKFETMSDFHAAWKDFMWESEERLLAEMKDLLKSNNIPLMIVCFPVQEQMDEGKIKRDKPFLLKPQRKLSVICRKLNIPLLDLWSDFYAKRKAENFYDYLHFRRAGNIIIADGLAGFIKGQQWIKGEVP